ncbi:glutamine amidotransferase [Rhizorhabdus dicambivorans]|uniref:Glutamine amidotransferase n=1 Tax=Rhizorhabdus dicambivorans TaxID=1850238 RepID=A0A2A4FS68_9SPHN|nr:glutamine amidotransferase [Rhizorhabdus dicambivorans]ATE64492.1 glutamine amidotransferase [Rhizorhabdus dicambivorans]PCE41585.1 glutamine amidotransferase [Rhizorhabdus dicambivorans]
MKTALIIRHTPYEGIAGFRAPVEAAGYEIDRIDVTDPDFANIDFDEPDLVVMMGGPMGVYETDSHPWIACEIVRLARRILLDRPTLGVCLGSQMMAAAMGARVYPGPVKEVGFAPVAISAAGQGSPLRHIEDVPVLHWHGDTFDLPEGAELLASTGHYAHQAFRRGSNILALQCHPEMGEDPRFDVWLEDEPYVAAAGQTIAGLREQHDRHGSAAVAAGRRMIADWLDRLE